MSDKPGIEAAVAAVFSEILTPVCAARELQLVASTGTATLNPQRIVITALDQGEEMAVKFAGRKLEVSIAVHASADDQDGAWMDATIAAVESTLQPPYDELSSLAPFACFVIDEFGAHSLAFDKCNWAKLFTIPVTALLS